MKTLRGRLNRGLAVILVSAFGAHWLIGSLAIHRVTENEVFTRLEHDSDALLANLSFDATGAPVPSLRGLPPVYAERYSGHYFFVSVGAARYRSPSAGDDVVQIAPLETGAASRFHADGPGGQPLLLLARGVAAGGRPMTLVIGEDLTPIHHDIHLASLAFLAFNALIMAVAMLFQARDVRLALAPLVALRRELSSIAGGQQARIVAETPWEIQPLVDEINRLLGVVERRLQQSRTAVGNLAHALKTPLAILFRVADAPAVAVVPAVRQQLQSQTAVIQARLERELKRARLAGHAAAGGDFHPQAELSVLIQVLRAVYHDKPLRFDVQVPPGPLPYDREDLLELLGNLADNAAKWARAAVFIGIEEQHDGLRITVADDGPGCAPEEIERLTRRGHRIDESKEGYGLGLSICRDIAAFYGGTLELGCSAGLGGLEVRVRLPRVRAAATNAGYPGEA